MHIKLDEELSIKLDEYFQARKGVSKSALIRKGLQYLFSLESPDTAKEQALYSVIDRKFLLPSYHTYRSFWGHLCHMKAMHPNDSSKRFWGEPTYLSSIDKTHKKIFDEIKDETSLLLAHRGKADGRS